MTKNRVVVLNVDLTCHRCNKKIKKVLHKYKERCRIETITFDKKDGKVTVAGPFDPEEVVRKLCREAGEAIRKWCIKKPEADKPSAGNGTFEPAKPTETDEKPTDKPPPDIGTKKPTQTEESSTTTGKTGPTCYPLPYPYPLPIYLPACSGNKGSCSCGAHCGIYRPCACGCGRRCSIPYHPLPPAYGRPCYWVCEEETTGCSIM